MPYVTDVDGFIRSQPHWPSRCLILQKQGQKGGVYGFFENEITAGATPDAAVIKGLFDKAYKTLESSDPSELWNMNTLPLCHFVGLYQVTVLVQQHNSVMGIYDGLSESVQTYMGVEK